MIIALIPGISPIIPLSAMSPLIIILTVSGIKDAMEDITRWRDDIKANGIKHEVLENGKFIKKETRNLQIGDILKIQRNEIFPADLIFLSSSSKNLCYVETANLDGESNLKRKNAVKCTNHLVNEKSLNELSGFIVVEEPSENLFDFSGNINLKEDPLNDKPLTIKNLLLRGSCLKNTKYIHGLVTYVGEDTKLFKNLKDSKSKFSTLDKKLNRLIIGLLIWQQILCIITVSFSSWFHDQYFIKSFYISIVNPTPVNLEFIVRNYLTSLVLYNLFIPMSLFVGLEFVKSIQAKSIEWDPLMSFGGSHTKVRTSNLNEELSQLDVIFTDKTGTLTDNIMIFKKCHVAGLFHSEGENLGGLYKTMASNSTTTSNRQQSLIYDLLLSFVLNHSVIPEKEEIQDDNDDVGSILYDGQSPDEIALLEAARQNKFELLQRTTSGLQIAINGKKEYYEILCTLDFTPVRKRMSVIVKTPDNRIILYSKGADNIMFERALRSTKEEKDIIRRNQNALIQYSSVGLRTLVVGCRELSRKEYDTWYVNVYQKHTEFFGKEREICKLEAYDQIEQKLSILGSTGIEDRLQEGVPESVDYLKRAGLKIWVLTGDKVETAINITQSANVINKETTSKIVIEKLKSSEICKLYLKRYIKYVLTERKKWEKKQEKNEKNFALIIDGMSLQYALDDHQDLLVELTSMCVSIVCCRVTPLQKGLVVKMGIKKFKMKGLAIGDGANDVTMIQTADVGVGILGREGSQASRAADFAIPRFKHLVRLIAIHGRYSYIRNCDYLHLSFYKNLVLVFSEAMFTIYTGFTFQTCYDSWIRSFYNTFYTSLFPFAAGILEKDIREEIILQHPEIYQSMRNGKMFNAKTIVRWIIVGIYQGCVVFFFAYLSTMDVGILGQHQMDGLWTFGTVMMASATFSIMLKTFLELKFITLLNYLTFIISIMAYVCAHLLFSSIPIFMGESNYYYIGFKTFQRNLKPYLVILLSVVTGCLPDLLFKSIQRQFFPSEWEKLMTKSVSDDGHVWHFKRIKIDPEKKEEGDEKIILLNE